MARTRITQPARPPDRFITRALPLRELQPAQISMSLAVYASSMMNLKRASGSLPIRSLTVRSVYGRSSSGTTTREQPPPRRIERRFKKELRRHLAQPLEPRDVRLGVRRKLRKHPVPAPGRPTPSASPCPN